MDAGLEKIVKLSEIEFPWDLTLEQTEALLSYVAKTLPGNISYRCSRKNFAGYPFDGDEFTEEKGNVQIAGEIRHKKEPSAFSSFRVKLSTNNKNKISSIAFHLMSDLGPNDYRPEVLQLWEDVKTIADDYFESEMSHPA